MKVLYSINYIQRDLYALEYKSKYIMVYRSSGMNPGRKGRFLPFDKLSDSIPRGFNAEMPGYIYKDFYFNKGFRTHRKEPGRMGPGIAEFLLEIETFLEDKVPSEINYDHIKTYTDIIPIATNINFNIDKAIKSLEPFDWFTLTQNA